ncbi:hypothetical protein L486_05316 [Kwoniella mangroviensis CBS 10435]|uniref:Uncharacterized protein n=1 Tax=Kwoniella mangroviensis CBS 10435 TaxID=1331196 RepID=A0A1B9IQQ3_9TREE|nr:hypothetical protein L486_05316 [Kwoniella mangroviensis CBS 10435]
MRTLHQVLCEGGPVRYSIIGPEVLMIVAQCIYSKTTEVLPIRPIRPAHSSPTQATTEGTPLRKSAEADPQPSSSPGSSLPNHAHSLHSQHSISVISNTHIPPFAPHRTAQPGWQTALETLGPVDLLMAVCRNTRMASYFLQPSEPPNFLHAFFLSIEDLQCFHHCVTYSFSIIVVSEDHNPWVGSVAPLFMTAQGEESTSGTALKLSMLYMGAVHLSYLQGRDGSTTASLNTRSLALNYRKDCLRLLRSFSSKKPPTCDAAVLSACALTLTADLLGTNPKWRELMRIVKNIVDGVGGMDVMIPTSTHVDPAMKCAVESLVTLSLLGASTGYREPGNTADLIIEQLRRFEELCGISRSLITLYATLSSFLITTGTSSFMDTEMAHRIESDWNAWVMTEGALESEERVKAGSSAIWQAGNISILRKIHKASRTDERVQKAAMAVLEICASVGDKVEYMNWPLIIACSTLTDPISRDSARAQLKLFVPQCCYEIEVVQMVCEEMWTRIDEGEDEQACGWVEILLESGCPVLLG